MTDDGKLSSDPRKSAKVEHAFDRLFTGLTLLDLAGSLGVAPPPQRPVTERATSSAQVCQLPTNPLANPPVTKDAKDLADHLESQQRRRRDQAMQQGLDFHRPDASERRGR